MDLRSIITALFIIGAIVLYQKTSKGNGEETFGDVSGHPGAIAHFENDDGANEITIYKNRIEARTKINTILANANLPGPKPSEVVTIPFSSVKTVRRPSTNLRVFGDDGSQVQVWLSNAGTAKKLEAKIKELAGVN